MRTAIIVSILTTLVLPGCAWERTVVNRQTRDLDLSFIKVNETTFSEVLARIGPPDVPLKDLRNFHYTSSDQRNTGLRLTYFLFIPFRWFDQQHVVDTLIELDERGVVTSVARSRRSTIRPPLEGEGSREVKSTELFQRGLQ